MIFRFRCVFMLFVSVILLLTSSVSAQTISPAERALGAFDAMDYETAYELLSSPELSNDADVIYSLALMYFEGIVVEADNSIACELFARSVQLGGVDARSYLMTCVEGGYQTAAPNVVEYGPSQYRWRLTDEFNLQRAASLYQASSSNIRIGEVYESGLGVVPSYLKAWDAWSTDEDVFTRGASRRLLAQSMLRVCGLFPKTKPLIENVLTQSANFYDPLADGLLSYLNEVDFEVRVNRIQRALYSETFTNTICRSRVVGGDLADEVLKEVLADLVREDNTDAKILLAMSLFHGDLGEINRPLSIELARASASTNSILASYIYATLNEYHLDTASFSVCAAYSDSAQSGLAIAKVKVAIGSILGSRGCTYSDEEAVEMLISASRRGNADAFGYYMILGQGGRISGDPRLMERYSLIMSANVSDIFDAHPTMLRYIGQALTN